MITFKGPQPPPENKKSGTSKYLVTWVDQFWSKDKECIKLLEEYRRTQIVDDFEPTQNGVRKFEQSQKVDDKGNGLYWTAVILSFSKLEE